MALPGQGASALVRARSGGEKEGLLRGWEIGPGAGTTSSGGPSSCREAAGEPGNG